MPCFGAKKHTVLGSPRHKDMVFTKAFEEPDPPGVKGDQWVGRVFYQERSSSCENHSHYDYAPSGATQKDHSNVLNDIAAVIALLNFNRVCYFGGYSWWTAHYWRMCFFLKKINVVWTNLIPKAWMSFCSNASLPKRIHFQVALEFPCQYYRDWQAPMMNRLWQGS